MSVLVALIRPRIAGGSDEIRDALCRALRGCGTWRVLPGLMENDSQERQEILRGFSANKEPLYRENETQFSKHFGIDLLLRMSFNPVEIERITSP